MPEDPGLNTDGELAQRITALRAALSVAPDDQVLRRLLVDALILTEGHTDAIAELKLLLANDPDNVATLVRLGEEYGLAGNPGAAEVIVEELERRGAITEEVLRLRSTLATASGGKVTEPPSGASGLYDPVAARPVTLTDVGGMDALKEAIRLKIIYPFQRPEVYRAYGKRPGGGLLLYGPPGCGKTHIARATAGEIGARFIAVGIADVLDMWLGNTERNLHDIFESARERRPSVLFFDEVDALAADRSDFHGTAGRTAVNQFLAEMDGVDGDNTGLLILAATNAPWHVDPAFRRPGRFDETLFVPPPDVAARAEIITRLLQGRPTLDIDIASVASATDGFSGADLRGLVDQVVENKVSRALREGDIRPITTQDLLEVAPAKAPSTREWFADVRNYVMYANQSGLYDPVKPYLSGR